MTADEVARKFGVDVKTVYEWARAGKLPHNRTPGGTYRFSAREINELYAKHNDKG